MPATNVYRATACAVGAWLAVSAGAASAACNSSFADTLGQVITGSLTLNGDACNLAYLVVRETGTLTLFDQRAGAFINGASDLSGSTWVQDASLENWGVLTNGALGSFYNIRLVSNRGLLQNDGRLDNLLIAYNFSGTWVNGATGVLTNATSGYLANYANLYNQNIFSNQGRIDNYAWLRNDAGATLASEGQFFNRAGATLTNDGTVRLLGGSVLEAGSTFYNNNVLDIGGRLLLQGQVINSGRLNILADGGDGLIVAAGSSYDFTTGMLSSAGTLTLETDFTETAANFGHIELMRGSTVINRATFTTYELGSGMNGVTFRNEGRLVILGYFDFNYYPYDSGFFNQYFLNEVNGRVEVKASGTLAFSQPASNLGRIENHGTLYISQSVTNERGASIVNSGYVDVNTVLWNDGELINSGTVKVVGPLPFHGLTGSGSYLQTAGLTQVDGDMVQGSVTILGGQLVVDGTLSTYASNGSSGLVKLLGGELMGSGIINGDVFVGGGPTTAVFKPGHSPGNFTINGDFTLLPGGELELEVERNASGQLTFDFIKASHMLLDGTVHLKLGANLGGADLTQLLLLDCGSGCEYGASFAYVVDGLAAGSLFSFSAQGLTLSISPAAAVPEPASVALWLVGVLGLGLRRRATRWQAQRAAPPRG